MTAISQVNPNTLAIAELKKMPSLAGRTPRNIFQAATIVMADLYPCKKQHQLYTRNFNDSGEV